MNVATASSYIAGLSEGGWLYCSCRRSPRPQNHGT